MSKSSLNQVRECTNAKKISESFKSLHQLNWAWTYEVEQNFWNQFACDENIIIEYRFQIFNQCEDKRSRDSVRYVSLGPCVIDFHKMTRTNLDEERSVCKIIRTNNKKRVRPLESERFSGNYANFEMDGTEYLQSNWLALNTLQLLDKKLPSVNEIMNGLISFMISHLVNMYGDVHTAKELDELLYNYQTAWQLIFMVGKVKNFDMALTKDILQNKPEHPVVQTILYINSMETILPQSIEKATRIKDESALPTLGPYVLALVHILSGANRARKGLTIKPNGSVMAFRGVKRTTTQIMRYEVGKILDIKGFCSTLLNVDQAIQAALELEDEQENEQLLMLIEKEGPLQPVIFQIAFTDVWAHFELNSDVYSSFPDEQEILLQDGMGCKITEIYTQKDFEGTGQ